MSNQLKIDINEVSPRDGFQNEAIFIPTEDKIAFINQLSASGFHKIEVSSFTSPKAIPALRDAEMVMHEIQRNPNVIYSALVPNLRGAERAIECKVDEINLVMSLSETHNIANLRMTREQSFAQIKAVIDAVQGSDVAINLSFSTVFGCPMEGDVSEQTIEFWIDRFAQHSVKQITLCDTTGMAYPAQVKRIFSKTQEQFPNIAFTAHFHNTRGMGLVNALAAAEVGITSFDAALGGLGGCPYAPGASGNVSTEDLVHMFELNGLTTGVDLNNVIAIAQTLPGIIEHDISSQVSKAGLRDKKHGIPDHVNQFIQTLNS